MTKRGFAGFVVASMVEDGGNTSYKVQKNEKEMDHNRKNKVI